MKILEYIPQLGIGGAERFCLDLSNELAKDNEVILCVSHPIAKNGADCYSKNGDAVTVLTWQS